ncbi:fumarylacetoacetate hydrolase family protein [Paraburkholderia hospita]|uniref:fumarylacetoacetate hydrolase family protein n=1 Tax=Paraburkholderia hospita TaxID=169430 RepID=UPI000B348EC6|nr:fumarylacetoacetate hydrolase family protein [Paraburkholderia hospita]OUL89997.1 hypothetical protein CA603_18030 [Paraburkholderia hospita]
MKLCSFTANNTKRYGAVMPHGGVFDLSARLGAKFPTLRDLIQNNGWSEVRQLVDGAQADYQESDIKFLPVFDESVTIHCVGLNYAAHTAEAGIKQPDFPRTFIKVNASLVGHREALEKPTLSPQFDFEGELAVIMGRPAYRVTAADALEYVAGYTCFMDGSVRDYQLERTIDQGKNFYRSSSMGPYLVTADEVGPLGQLTVTTLVSGETMQHSAFHKMIFSVPTLIEYITSFTELRPGDVIATGTPEGVGFKRSPPRYLQPGDTVEVIVERVGRLVNVVR